MGNYDFTLDLESENTMSIINDWIQPCSNVLEFGSANGRLTKYLSEEKKCEVTIVEIDEDAGAEAQKYAKESYIGENVGNIESYFWANSSQKYHYIIFGDVLEHLRNPKKVLQKCQAFLEEDGKILVSIPNIAHNSVIIDLLIGKFEYQPVGLLDRTHIHFFTHSSFEKMVKECGLFVNKMIPIYSRVSNNEIKNSYCDIPIEVAQFLRKRTEGSVYQYVYKLSASPDNEKEQEIIKGLEIEQYEELESLCFYKKNMSDEYCDEKRIGKCYFENQDVKFEIDLEKIDNSTYLRWHPSIYNGIVWLKKCEVITKGCSCTIDMKNGNFVNHIGPFLIFDKEFPWIEFEEIPPKMSQGKVLISFSVIVYRKSNEYFEKLQKLLGVFWKENTIIPNTIYQKQKAYIEHLERDLTLIKQDAEKFQKHLENDIREQKNYIKQLEEMLETKHDI